MKKNELDIRVLATIRTDLALKKRALEAILSDYEDYTTEQSQECASLDLHCAIGDLEAAIDRLNELAKEQ